MISLLFYFSKADEKYTNGILSKLYDNGELTLTGSGSGKIWLGESWKKTDYSSLVNQSNNDWCSLCDTVSNTSQYIIFNAEKRPIKLDSYLIKGPCIEDSCFCNKNGYCGLENWELLASNDYSKWTLIDSVTKAVIKPCEKSLFEIKNKNDYFKYYKFIQKGFKAGCYGCFSINGIEFYGNTKKNLNDYIKDVLDSDNEEQIEMERMNNQNLDIDKDDDYEDNYEELDPKKMPKQLTKKNDSD